MARIRTIKPEAFVSESLAEVSLSAERTFFGLLTQVDDSGRLRDNAAVLQGAIWPLRPAHTAADVEEDLRQLEKGGLICRYRGSDGKRFLHLPTFALHQRISHPTPTKLPACPSHDDPEGGPKPDSSRDPDGSGNSPDNSGVIPEGSGSSGVPAAPAASVEMENAADLPGRPGDLPLDESSGTSPEPSGISPLAHVRAHAPEVEVEVEVEGEKECAPLASVTTLPPPAPEAAHLAPAAEPDALFEYAPAARGGETPPALEPVLNSQTLIAEWIDFRTRKSLDNKPPKRTIGQVSKELKQLLDEVSYEVVRQGFMEWDAKGASPSALASFVNQVQSRRARDAVAIPAQRPSATTLRTQAGLSLMQEFAAEEGVDLSTLLPSNVIPIRREITA